MRRLLVLALTSSVVLSALIAVVVAFARQQPAPDDLARLHLTDCELPCWIGIRPGVTTWEEAKEKVIQTYGKDYNVKFENSLRIVILHKIARGDLTTDIYLQMTMYSNRDIVSGIIFNTQHFPTLASLYYVLGTPNGVSAASKLRIIIFYYGNTNYNVSVGYDTYMNTRLDWAHPVRHIYVFDGANKCLGPWRGFRDLQFYYSNYAYC